MDLVEHELAGYPRLGSVEFARLPLKRHHHLLHHLVEKHSRQLRMQQWTELERDLRKNKNIQSLLPNKNYIYIYLFIYSFIYLLGNNPHPK